MALSPIGWVLWLLAAVGLAALWFVPNLPAVWAGLAFITVGGFLLYLGDNSWPVVGITVLGAGLTAFWLMQRHRKPRTMKEQLEDAAAKEKVG